MFDTQGVRHLAETIEAVRATAREQIPYNTEEVSSHFVPVFIIVTDCVAALDRLLQESRTGDAATLPGDQGESGREESSRSVCRTDVMHETNSNDLAAKSTFFVDTSTITRLATCGEWKCIVQLRPHGADF